MEDYEVLSYWVCPNCQSKNFLIEKRICLDCGYSLQVDNLDDIYFKKLEETKNNLNNTLKDCKITSKRLKLKKYNFESYKILIKHNKICCIKFYVYDNYFGKKAFLLNIIYKIKINEIDEIEFYESELEERQHHYTIKHIQLKLPYFIFEKAKNWYKERKKLTYYKQINLTQLREFITEIIKTYHKII